LTPLLRVAEVERSIRFYELLGLVKIATDGCNPLGWARLRCEGGAVMLQRAGRPIDMGAQAVSLYLYTPDLLALRKHLIDNAVKVQPIVFPEYMPRGEMNVFDPDGYLIHLGHWGKAEQEEWDKRINATK
jgi:hypothetical protein